MARTIAALAIAPLLAIAPARADFFDDARKTLTNDTPHFFQDDIPCAFGGQPTSHTKTSCNDKGQQQQPVNATGRAASPPVQATRPVRRNPQ